MRTIFVGVGLISAAFAIAFSPVRHLVKAAESVVSPDGQRIPQPRDKRGPRMPTRCPKSERMARLRNTQRRDAIPRHM